MLAEPTVAAGSLSKADWQTYKRIVNGLATGSAEDDESGAATDAPPSSAKKPRTTNAPSTDQPSLSSRVSDGNLILDVLKLRPISRGDVSRGDAAQADAKCPLYVLTSRTATSTTLIFGGNNRRQFLLPLGLLLDHDTNLVLLRDPKRCFCLAGLPYLGTTYDKTIVNLKRLVAELGGSTLFTIGVSAGGSAALKFGCDLNADGVLGFSVPTTLDLDDDPGAELRHYPQLALLYRQDRALGIDLAKYYRTRLPRPRVTMVYSPGHVRDRWLAERMMGVDGVELVETTGYSGHNTFKWCNTEGRLDSLFDRLYASRLLKTASTAAPPALPARPDDLERRAKTALDRKAAKAATTADQ